jgi:hypothetical protein
MSEPQQDFEDDKAAPPRRALSADEMTLRDFAAVHILAGMNATLVRADDWPTPDMAEKMAENALMQADAFMRARGPGA